MKMLTFRRVLTLALVLSIAPLAGAATFPDPVVPQGFGVNIHFTGAPRDLDLIAEGGFRFIRMDFGWQAVERERGQYTFDAYDALTSACLARGIRPLYILDYSNRLYEQDRSVQTEEGRQAFAAFAAAAAARYAGKGIVWEIWNEPNIKQFWVPQPSVEAYAKLVEVAAPRIREADPDALVVGPATSQIPREWLAQLFERGFLQHVDAVTVHPYRSDAPETVIADYARLRELIKKHAPAGKTLPILSGEWGYSNINWNKKPLGEDQQARYLVRMFLVNLAQGVPISIWYDWKNDGTNPEEREHHFGTMNHDLTPKPAYKAAQALARPLDGYRFLSRLGMADDKDYVLGFVKDSQKAVALWRMEGEHAVTLPLGAGKGTLVDMFGESKEISWKDAGPRITLTESPQYLLLEGQ